MGTSLTLDIGSISSRFPDYKGFVTVTPNGAYVRTKNVGSGKGLPSNSRASLVAPEGPIEAPMAIDGEEPKTRQNLRV